MPPIHLKTQYKKLLADLYTPVGIYLRIREQFPKAILLESADNEAAQNSFSYIALNPIASIAVNKDLLTYNYPRGKKISVPIKDDRELPDKLMSFIRNFKSEGSSPVPFSESFFGYTAYEGIRFFENLNWNPKDRQHPEIPLLRYALYQYVIAINHYKEELYLCENQIDGIDSKLDLIETAIRSKDFPLHPFKVSLEETSNMTDDHYKKIVQKGIDHCNRGDVFQIVLSRSFQQEFTGDDFNAYRALRSINPSPYLFYFDYGKYRLMGSSPESQLIIKKEKVVIHPIAGTVKRTGDPHLDQKAIHRLKKDPKENAEHVMLVDLARNDLSRFATQVHVSADRKIQAFSHVIHLVSEVTGTLPAHTNPFALLAATFPAGTLSGAPKIKAMELIHQFEETQRGFYAGCIGAVGLNGDFNHAIMIRSFLSKNNVLRYQAGAGIVAQSIPENELQEVNNKLNALKEALKKANTL